MTKTIFGLPVTGLMGTNPARTIGIVMMAASFVVNYLVGQGYISPPTPELQSIFDEHGYAAAAIVVGVGYYIAGEITRNRVVSPATAAAAAPQLVETKV